MVIHFNKISHFRSKSDEWVAIADASLRKKVLAWTRGKLTLTECFQLRERLRKQCPELFPAFAYVLQTYGMKVPEAIRQFYSCVASNSPVCSFLHPRDTDLVKRLTEPKCRSDVAYLQTLRRCLPVFFNLLLTETLAECLARDWISTISLLVDKSSVPFDNAHAVFLKESSDEDLLSW